MTHSPVGVVENAVATTNKWLNDVSDRLAGRDPQRAYRALRAVLHAVRDRLGVNEASHLAAQLPMLIRGLYYEGYHPAGKPLNERSKSDFLTHIKREFPDESFDTEKVTRAVLEVVTSHITPGELEKIKMVVPEEIRSLWP
jgi:uncharacterized protein (DUF2267 family)